MTQDEIIKLAREAGMQAVVAETADAVERFAKLVAAHVSRELAKECAGSGEWTAVHIIEAVRW